MLKLRHKKIEEGGNNMSNKSNPFNLGFGEVPSQYISRFAETEKILNSFTSETPFSRSFILVGVRGSGKTVMMSDISDKLKKEKNWVIVNLTPDCDNIIAEAISDICRQEKIKRISTKAQIGSPIFSVDISLENSNLESHEYATMRTVLDIAKKRKKKVLFTIDEIVANKSIKKFTSLFQILVREKYPVFLLMTGLYDNVANVQDGKTSTFLYRSIKVNLAQLNVTGMAYSYEQTLGISKSEALDMAKKTNGYSYAFQLLGYYTWEKMKGNTKINTEISTRQHLEEYAYNKIWSEISKNEKQILNAMALQGENKVSALREITGFKTNEFSVYRSRLIGKGIVSSPDRGYLEFVLPYFGEFIVNMF